MLKLINYNYNNYLSLIYVRYGNAYYWKITNIYIHSLNYKYIYFII